MGIRIAPRNEGLVNDKITFTKVISSRYNNAFAIQPFFMVGLLLIMKILHNIIIQNHNALILFSFLFILFILGLLVAFMMIAYFIRSLIHFFEQLKTNALFVLFFSVLTTVWVLTHRAEISSAVFENSLIFLLICLCVYVGFPLTVCFRTYIQKKTLNNQWTKPLTLFATAFGLCWYYMIFLDIWSVLKLFSI